MRKNTSPWLHQLNKDRVSKKLSEDITTDVAVVGAGIAGISTAFYILKNTDKKVVLLERFKLAHGATGHNAGQVVSYFERGFSSIVTEFGLVLAKDGQKSVDDAWHLLDEMYTDAGLNIPFSRFDGHTGLCSFDQVLLHLQNNLLRKKASLNTERVLISSEAEFIKNIPEQYEGLYSLVPQKEILDILETEVKDFVALLSFQKGCINSALFCEEILFFLLERYPDRFTLYEHTSIGKIVLHHDGAILDAVDHTINASRVVLCTNGFESLTIINETGLDVDARYHHNIDGMVGYMVGYLEKMNKPPTAISYFTDPSTSFENPYIYLTRRPYEYEKGNDHNLISVGGPAKNLEDSSPYSHEDEYPDEASDELDKTVRKIYNLDQNRKIEYIFTWHGLMGYTKNGIRMVGPEPKNPVLLYNLGCNGIGILPSIFGGKKIARHIAGENVEKSIFDVPVRIV